MTHIPLLTEAEKAALPPCALGHARHFLKSPVATVLKGADGDEMSFIHHVDLRLKVKGRDMRATDAATGEVSRKLVLLARLVGHPLIVIDEMDAEDITALMELQENPTPPGQQTGNAVSG